MSIQSILDVLKSPYSEEEGMKEIQEIRRMLEQMNVGTVSSHTNAVSFVLNFVHENQLYIVWFKLQIEMNESSSDFCPNLTTCSVLRGASNSNHAISVRTNGITSRNSTGDHSSVTTLGIINFYSVMMINKFTLLTLFRTFPGSESQFSPSESSSSFNEDHHSLSATSHSSLVSPVDLNGIVPFRAPSDVPFPWHPDLSTLNTGPSPSWTQENIR